MTHTATARTAEITLTRVERDLTNSHGTRTTYWRDAEHAATADRFYVEGVSFGPARTVTHTYRAGMLVELRAAGKNRTGTVVRVGRTKAYVAYALNSGEERCTAFGALEIHGPASPEA